MRLGLYEYVTAECGPLDTPESLRREGRAMLEALQADFRRVPGVTAVGWMQTLKPDDRAAFQAFIQQHDYTLIIAPEFANLLYTRCQWAIAAGGRLLNAGLDAIALTADKLRCGQHLKACGIPTPPTHLYDPERLPPAAWATVVVKPRWGAGSQATFKIALHHETALYRQLPATPDWCGEAVVQPFLPGTAASVAFLVGPHRHHALPPAAQTISADGRCRYLGGSLPLDDALADRATRLAQRAVEAVPGLQGYVGVDLILGNHPAGSGDAVVEINPRVTTSYVGLRQLARTNLAETLFRLVQGEPFPEPRWHSGRVVFQADGSWRTDS